MKFPCIVPDGVSGDWRVETFVVSQKDSDWTRIRATFHPNEFVAAGTYKRLMRRNTVVMSNTEMELRTNRAIISAAHGRILINGLGLGVVLTAILEKPQVEHVTVVEKSDDVIKLVAPSFAKDRVTIIHGDAFDHAPMKGERFGAVWHDIWDSICGDNLAQMRQLKQKYCRRTDWQGCWGYYECLR